MANSWEFVVSYLAILELGHIAMPLDPTFKQLEAEAVVKQIPPLFVLTNRHYSPLLKSYQEKLLIFDDLSQAGTAEYQPLRLEAKDQIASLVFTSGTTGTPKAAPYTHRNHIWNIEVCSRVWDWDTDDSLLISLPLSHWYGLVMGLSGILYHGNSLYLQDWFDETATLKALASGKVTLFTHISTIYLKLLEAEGDYDLSSVRLCISGGSALPPAVWQRFADRFGQEILECYGSSETGRIASNLLDERLPGSPGRVLDGVKLKFSADGEVLVKSDGLFPGYYKNPGATQASRTPDGFWRTGDLGVVEAGRVVLKGRLQERIRRFGYTISPRDIEWALHQESKVKEVYVMGIQDNQGPNDKLAYFISGDITEDQIKDYCKANLPYAWRPDSIILVERLPRTKNGKPKISQIKQMVA